MALKINSNQYGLSSLLKEGNKSYQGLEEAVYRNIYACKEMCQMTASSFGPSGMNKLVVNQLDKLFLTSDAGTILRELDVQHPAAKLILMASQQQEKEVGDGTNFVVVLAGELLSQAEQLLRIGLSPAIIIEGYELATKKALELLEGETIPNASISDIRDKGKLKNILKSVVASKQSGMEDFLSDLLVHAVNIALPKDNAELRQFNIDNIRTVKIIGGSFHNNSHIVNGMVLLREPETHVKKANQAKVAVYACPIDTGRTETKSTVLLHSSEEMRSFSLGEEKIIESQIRSIAESGVKVIVTGDQIGELALHYLNRHGLVALRIQSKFDLRRFCRAVGANPLSRLGAPTEEEAGFCDVLEAIEIGGQRCTVIRQDRTIGGLATIVLRGNTLNQLDDLERAIEDGVNTVRTLIIKDNRVLAGAGAVEIELARKLTSHGETTPGLVQYGIKAYATSFEAVPRILATNAGHNAIEALSRLYWSHDHEQPHAGIDLDNPEAFVQDSQTNGIFDSYAMKKSAIQLATEAALTVLRVDQIIMAKPAGGPKPRGPAPQDEDD